MNFLQICNRVKQNCGISGSDMTNVTGQVGEFLSITNWVNEAWMDIQAMRQDWDWMRKSIAFPTVAHQVNYTTSQIGITDFGKWDRNTFRNYANPVVTMTIANPGVITLAGNLLSAGDGVIFYTTGALPTGITPGLTYYVVSPTTDTFQVSTIVGGSPVVTSGSQSGTHTITSTNTLAYAGFRSEIFMTYTDYDAFRNAYLYGALRQTATRPIELTITPDKSLSFGPIADAGYTIVGDYYSTPSEMSANTDTPSLPSKFHLAIVYKAMVAYGLYEAAAEQIQRGQTEYEKWMRRILADQNKEVLSGGALA